MASIKNIFSLYTSDLSDEQKEIHEELFDIIGDCNNISSCLFKLMEKTKRGAERRSKIAAEIKNRLDLRTTQKIERYPSLASQSEKQEYKNIKIKASKHKAFHESRATKKYSYEEIDKDGDIKIKYGSRYIFTITSDYDRSILSNIFNICKDLLEELTFTLNKNNQKEIQLKLFLPKKIDDNKIIKSSYFEKKQGTRSAEKILFENIESSLNTNTYKEISSAKNTEIEKTIKTPEKLVRFKSFYLFGEEKNSMPPFYEIIKEKNKPTTIIIYNHNEKEFFFKIASPNDIFYLPKKNENEPLQETLLDLKSLKFFLTEDQFKNNKEEESYEKYNSQLEEKEKISINKFFKIILSEFLGYKQFGHNSNSYRNLTYKVNQEGEIINCLAHPSTESAFSSSAMRVDDLNLFDFIWYSKGDSYNNLLPEERRFYYIKDKKILKIGDKEFKYEKKPNKKELFYYDILKIESNNNNDDDVNRYVLCNIPEENIEYYRKISNQSDILLKDKIISKNKINNDRGSRHTSNNERYYGVNMPINFLKEENSKLLKSLKNKNNTHNIYFGYRIINKGKLLTIGSGKSTRKDAATIMSALHNVLADNKNANTSLSANDFSKFIFPKINTDWRLVKSNKESDMADENGLIAPPASQEWCHLRGHGDGGTEIPENFVSGSFYCNSEQLSIENAQRVHTYYSGYEFRLSATAYLFDDKGLGIKNNENYINQNNKILKNYNELKIRKEKNKRTRTNEIRGEIGSHSPLAAFIRYRIYIKNRNDEYKKIINYCFEGQSEFFDKNQYNILHKHIKETLEGEIKKLNENSNKKTPQSQSKLKKRPPREGGKTLKAKNIQNRLKRNSC